MKRILGFALAIFLIATAVGAQTIVSPSYIRATKTFDDGSDVLQVTTERTAGVTVQLTGTFNSSTISFRVSNNGSTWIARNCFPPSSSSAATSATAAGGWECSVAGWRYFQAAVTAGTPTSVAVTINGISTGGGVGGGGGGAGVDPVRVHDGTDIIEVNADGSINMVCASGCAGGVQYTEGDTDASITGTALLFEGGSNTLVAAPGTAANGLLVDVSRVTGTVTVSATNLDVQSGGGDLALQSAVDGIETLLAGGLPAALGSNGGLKIEGAVADVADDAAISGGPNTVPIACRAEDTSAAVSADDDKSDVRCDMHGNLGIAGNVRHDDADTAYPVGIGFRAIAHGANPTAVAAADRTVAYANRAGVPFVIGGHPNVISREAQVEDADGAQTNAAIVTVSAGTKIVVTRAGFRCDGGNSGPVNAVLGFGTATIPARAAGGTSGIVAAFDGIPAGSGDNVGDGSGIIGVGADDEDLRLTMEDPAGGACSVLISYYTIES